MALVSGADPKSRSTVMFAFLRWARRCFGYDKYSSKTVDRLLYSKHVEDLRWIAFVGFVATVLAVLVIGSMALTFRIQNSPAANPVTTVTVPSATQVPPATR